VVYPLLAHVDVARGKNVGDVVTEIRIERTVYISPDWCANAEIGKPLVSNKTDQKAGKLKSDHLDWIMRFDKVYGSRRMISNPGPGAAPVNPAQDFFKAMAPAAKQAVTQSEHGPAL
jgi:hypothetical protein